jgi:hypothetical protein
LQGEIGRPRGLDGFELGMVHSFKGVS